jgi:hypothetical protein
MPFLESFSSKATFLTIIVYFSSRSMIKFLSSGIVYYSVADCKEVCLNNR